MDIETNAASIMDAKIEIYIELYCGHKGNLFLPG